MADNEPAISDDQPWYHGITRYQWTVLIIASLGWVFDIFEGQIFVASMNEAMPSLVPAGTDKGTIAYYNQVTLALFLLGGALGGVVFGVLGDRIGRKKTMSLTIVMYSLFTALSAFSQEWWHMAGFRFLVAMGVGGEWAVASAMVAEVFPKRARARVSGIFHASSVFGTYLAIAASTLFIGSETIHQWAVDQGIPSAPWRIGFGVGVLPALLIIWIRRSLKEPESWEQAKSKAAEENKTASMGRINDLFKGALLRSTFVGVTLAAVGLATFWGAHIFGKDLMRRDVEKQYVNEAGATTQTKAEILDENKASIKRWEMLGMLLVTTGGGIGLLSFGPLCERFGRKATFLGFHLGGLIIAVLTFQFASGVGLLLVVLPIFGFLTLGMHAGYAIYFPELYPTRLRGTGAGFCFNFGRIIAAPILIIRGKLRQSPADDGSVGDLFALGLSLEDAASLLCLLFLVGVIVLIIAPETKGRELPE